MVSDFGDSTQGTLGIDPSGVAMFFGSADLSVSKTDSPDPVTAGNNLTYTVAVTNNGPDDATGVTLTDTLPAGVTFVSASAGCNESGGVVTCSIGSIADGDSAMVEIVVTPATDGMITNTAEVSGDQMDEDDTNNST